MKLIRWCIEDCGYGIGVRGFDSENGNPVRSLNIVTISGDDDLLYVLTRNGRAYDLVLEDADIWFLDRTLESFKRLKVDHILSKLVASAVIKKERETKKLFTSRSDKTLVLYCIGTSIIDAYYKNNDTVERLLPVVCDGLFIDYGTLKCSDKQLISWQIVDNTINIVAVGDVKEIDVENKGSDSVIVNDICVSPEKTYVFSNNK